MKKLIGLGLLAALLAACSSGDDPPPTTSQDAFTQSVAETAAISPDDGEPRDTEAMTPSESETAEPVAVSMP